MYQIISGKEQTAMADAGSGAADYPVLVITFIVGATVFVLVYISSLLKSSKGGDGSKSKGIIISDALRRRRRPPSLNFHFSNMNWRSVQANFRFKFDCCEKCVDTLACFT